MIKAAYWRGSAKATKKPEFMMLMKALRPRKKDVFYDLGCGHANTCIWASKKVGRSIGIENFGPRYKKAIKNVIASNSKNVKILKKDVSQMSYKDATIIYSVIDLAMDDFKRIQKSAKPRTKIALYGPPPYPMKSKKFGRFFICNFPYKRVKNPDEYSKIYLGKKNATIKDMYKSIGRLESKRLKWYVSRGESSWKKLNS